ncbi:reverse transcriptase domain-containing protein, partial [Peribacillus aracenensis]|uniref:reverse transcriptase domain-containing protein n=1 Tax=Peribacillus aracenensis TaxID=2976708 RepID=UPI0021A3548E
PLLSNIMLNELDKELEKRGLRFVRYADDALIFVKSEKAANRVMSTIVRFIEEKLGLIVNVEKSRISRPKELKFLGFGYYYDTITTTTK